MNLIIDIGNSAVKIALFMGDSMQHSFRVTHEEVSYFIEHCIRTYPIEQGIVSSVIPLSDSIQSTLKHLPFPCLRMSASLKYPFKICYHTPETLGHDRLAAVTAACSQEPHQNILIIDVGTAITYDFVTAAGEYLGGNISPGIGMRFKALHQFTGKLPLVDKEGTRCEIGYSTETAIREGVLQGVAWEIEGIVKHYSQKHPHLLIFLTGGNAFLLGNRIKNSIFADKFLVLKGLNRILALNNEAI